MSKSANSLVKYILAVFFLVLGLLHPTSKFDLFASLILFGFLLFFFCFSYFFSKRNKVLFKFPSTILITGVSFGLLIFFAGTQESILTLIFYLTIGFSIGLVFMRLLENRSQIILFALILFFLISSIINAPNLIRRIKYEPQPRTYFNDQLSFLRVFYIVENGGKYYSAVVKAITEDGRNFKAPQQVWGWRMPTYAYLWKYIPGKGGVSIYIFFLIICASFIYYSYVIAKHFLDENTSLIIPYLTIPYFHYAARDVAFLEMEWWGVIFFTAGLYYFIKNKTTATFLFLFLAVAIREIFIIPILAIAFISLLLKKYVQLVILFFVGLFFLTFFVIHFLNVTNYIGKSFDVLAPRAHPLSIFFLQQTLSYGSWEYLTLNFRPFLILLIASILGGAVIVFQKKLNFHLAILIVSVLSMVVAVLRVGTPPYDDYWGVSYIPVLIITTPIILFRAVNQKFLEKPSS